MSIADIRKSYHKFDLLETNVAASPYEQFGVWLEQAIQSEVLEPTAMVLATATISGKPSTRIVLLKGFDKTGFVFFTNYNSRKGLELQVNSRASLLFFWPELERQVRIEGIVAKVSPDESDAYYNSRPLGSRIGAWASPQSQQISHEYLAARAHQLAEKLGESPDRPAFWGGYRLAAVTFEFWQGRPSRLHDRLVYSLDQENIWQITRLAP